MYEAAAAMTSLVPTLAMLVVMPVAIALTGERESKGGTVLREMRSDVHVETCLACIHHVCLLKGQGR